MRKAVQLFLLFLLLLFIAPLSCSEKPREAPAPDKKIIVGYVPGFRGVLDNGMAGMMFWQYARDPKEYLLDAMNEHLYR